MNGLDDSIRQFRRIEEGRLRIEREEPTPFVAVDPAGLEVEVAADVAVRLVIVHRKATDTPVNVRIRLQEKARLTLTEVFFAPAAVEMKLKQAAHSASRITTLQLAGADAAYRTELDGAQAESVLHGLFLAGGDEHCAVRLHTAHNAADCRSEALVKGVAGGTATGRFEGLVYVAPDAQRTDAQQQSRNVLLSDTARIDTLPQLEIYADDVKCSHGATVGRMDDEAILYMRQRGLSEAAARRLQLEGFAADVVRHCGIEPLCETLMEAVAEKMNEL